jgi:hypothetical protein
VGGKAGAAAGAQQQPGEGMMQRVGQGTRHGLASASSATRRPVRRTETLHCTAWQAAALEAAVQRFAKLEDAAAECQLLAELREVRVLKQAWGHARPRGPVACACACTSQDRPAGTQQQCQAGSTRLPQAVTCTLDPMHAGIVPHKPRRTWAC